MQSAEYKESAGQSSVSTVNPKKKKYTCLAKRNYILQRTIGGGYCGVVKLATSALHGCDVAIKIVSKFEVSNEYLTKFFPREIVTMRTLRHENLIKYLQSLETTHRIYIIMEYAVNGNLYDFIKSHVYVKEPQSRQWFQQLVNAVDYCHSQEIVHRDIKCENILLDKSYNIKLSDFGFARRVRKVNFHIKLVNTFCGSYAYTAPEILKGWPYNPMLSDIWSMGVVLYAMVHGCLPFDDSNYFILLKQVKSEVEFPAKPKISDSCRALIVRILKPRHIRPTMESIKKDVWLIGHEPEIQDADKIEADKIDSTTVNALSDNENGSTEDVSKVAELPSEEAVPLDQTSSSKTETDDSPKTGDASSLEILPT